MLRCLGWAKHHKLLKSMEEVHDSVLELHEILRASGWPAKEERVIIKRTWRRLWKRKRVRQEWQRVGMTDTHYGNCLYNWVDVEVLPDLPRARTMERTRRTLLVWRRNS